MSPRFLGGSTEAIAWYYGGVSKQSEAFGHNLENLLNP